MWIAQKLNKGKHMNKTMRSFASMALSGMILVAANVAFAQVATTTTQTTSVGTVREFGPDMITVQTQTSPTPIRYSFTKTTTYVDESGNPVSIETVKSGLPVTVFYDKEGDQMVASKVVVKKTVSSEPLESTTTTTRSATTTSAGTIKEFGPSTTVVKSETAP